MKKIITILTTLYFCLFTLSAQATVVLVYHHVSADTPKSTSITPSQFKLHLQYLKDNSFKVIALNEMVEKLKNKQPLEDKTVVITFDDGYSDILHNGHPLLKEYNYPYTMFINPNTVPEKKGMYLTWDEIKHMSDEDVLIANHGLMHDSLIKVPAGESTDKWLSLKLDELVQAEQIKQAKIGNTLLYLTASIRRKHSKN